MIETDKLEAIIGIARATHTLVLDFREWKFSHCATLI